MTTALGAQSAQTADVRAALKIHARDFTYCQFFPGGMSEHAFLVSSPIKRDAEAQARAYIAAKGWPPEGTLNLYPRKYAADARRLYAQGRSDFA